MILSILSPTKAFLTSYTEEELSSLRKQLTYTNKSIQFQLKKHSLNHIWQSRNFDSWQLRKDELQKQLKPCLVFEEDGKFFIRPGSVPWLTGLDIQVENQVVYPKPKKIPWFRPLPFELHPYQEESWTKLLEEKHGNVSLTTGCHSKGTKILMYDGTIKNVEDVVVGDKLMGPDSKPRNVLELHTGEEQMYEISPIKGDPFIVNGGHILSLQRTNLGNTYLRKDGTRYAQEKGANPVLNISVRNYLNLSKTQKHIHKLYRTGVEFSKNIELKIPPYILGLWLGDGASSRCSLTTMDEEIRKEWCGYIESIGLEISILEKESNKAKAYGGIIPEGYIPSKKMQNIFNILLNNYELLYNKHIPKEYLTSTRENRLELLAGLIDTDGYYHNGCFEIVQKNNFLSENILFLARSLGLSATSRKKKSGCQTGTIGEYNRIIINGDISEIPSRLQRKRAPERIQIKSVLRTGFSVKPVEIGKYYGFTLDGDHLYLMGDFTVTHNSGKSAIILKLCHELGLNTCIVVPSKSIFEELSDKFEYHFGKSKIGYFGAGKKNYIDKKFVIAIGDSLANIMPDSEEWKFFSSRDVLIVDESHEFAAESLEAVCHGVLANINYRFFFSATQLRNDGSGPLLHSIIGKTVCTLSTAEAVSRGYICPHEFRIINIESSNPSFDSSDAIELKRMHLLRNTNIANFCAKLCNATSQLGQGTLILVEELSQIAMLVPLLKVPYAIAHSEKRKERLEELKLEKVDNAESVEKFNKNEVKVLVGTSCIATGTNIFPCHNVVNWVGGSSPIKTKQGAVGRGVRFGKSNPWASKCLPKGKTVIYDFNIENYVMEKHLEARLECYKESGDNLIKYVRLK